MHPGMQNP